MPEEINRVLTDQISDLLFTTEAQRRWPTCSARASIAERVHFVGNVMIDTLHRNLERAPVPTLQPDTLGAANRRAAMRVAHAAPAVQRRRPRHAAPRCWTCWAKSARSLPVVFPLHPRTRGNIETFGFGAMLDGPHFVCRRMGYLEMLGLMTRCQAGADRFRRHPGRNHRARRALPHPAREHRTPDHRGGGHQYPGRAAIPTRSAAAFDEILANGGKARPHSRILGRPRRRCASPHDAERLAADAREGVKAA